MLGAGYMAAIKPFRNLIVYPRMMRDMGRRWRDGASALLSQPPDREDRGELAGLLARRARTAAVRIGLPP